MRDILLVIATMRLLKKITTEPNVSFDSLPVPLERGGGFNRQCANRVCLPTFRATCLRSAPHPYHLVQRDT